MSGPIVRKYGFPNHEQIFGKKEMAHGAEPQEGETAPNRPPETGSGNASAEPTKKGTKNKGKKGR